MQKCYNDSMSKKFNLLLLHLPEDTHPRSWICLKSPKLSVLIRKLEKNILGYQQQCRESLSKEISRRLNCAHTTIKWILQGKRKFYPIPVILELLKFTRKRQQFLKQLETGIEYLKVNSASAKPIKAVYELNENMAKILGAFMADGSLGIQKMISARKPKDWEAIRREIKALKINYFEGEAPSRQQHYISIRLNKNNTKALTQLLDRYPLLSQTHYNIELSDAYKDNVEAFLKWIRKEFAIDPTIFKLHRNAWRAVFSNKILARYLMCFFEVKPGPKAYDAFEPSIIQRSNLKIRQAFARGVLMFDGCLNQEKKILFNTKSKKLVNSIAEIWQKDNIKFGRRVSLTRNENILFTTAENRRKKLLNYFEENTQKWKLFHWLAGDLNYTPVFQQDSPITSKKVLKILQKIKCCDAVFLQKYFKCSHRTIRIYLKILKDQRRIKLSNRPSRISEYVDKNTTVLLTKKLHNIIFKKIRGKFKNDKNFAQFLDVHKATLSAWRVRKNRIPICILREMSSILSVDSDKLYSNVEKTDREIAEII